MPYAARTAEDLIRPEKILSMSGLEFMQGILEGRISGAPMAETMNFNLSEVTDGRVTFEGAPAFGSLNPSGAVHGGWYGTILDSALGCAVMTKVPQGSVYTTLEYKVNIIRALPLDTPVICCAEVDHAGRSTSIAHGEIRGKTDGRLYATGSTTCIIMKLA